MDPGVYAGRLEQPRPARVAHAGRTAPQAVINRGPP